MKRAAAGVALPLAERITTCRACPRLVAHREAIGRDKRKAYRDDTYWARPILGFGDAAARLLIVGLAPGAHGANRTGRVFTGDRSGDFLYAALHRAGLANQPTSVSQGDGLVLRDAFITMPVRCAPPDNSPTRDEVERCRPLFHAELELLPHVASVLALGSLAFGEVVEASTRARGAARPRFAHGAEVALPNADAGPFSRRATRLFGSYHVSQQNTQTGRLTAAMFDDVLGRALTAARAP